MQGCVFSMRYFLLKYQNESYELLIKQICCHAKEYSSFSTTDKKCLPSDHVELSIGLFSTKFSYIETFRKQPKDLVIYTYQVKRIPLDVAMNHNNWQKRKGWSSFFGTEYCSSEAVWAYSYGIFPFCALAWITPYSLAAARRTGWLTRDPGSPLTIPEKRPSRGVADQH